MHLRCPNFQGLFTTRVIKSHVKLYVKFDAQERELYHCQNFDPECEYSKHKAFRVRKATRTFKKQAPGDIRIVKGIIVYLTKSCLISYGIKLLILRSKHEVCNTLLRRYVEITRHTDDLSLKT